MKLSPRAAAVCAIALTLLLAVGLYWTQRKRTPPVVLPNPPTPSPNGEKPEEPPQVVGQIRLSDDADAKSGEFWLEQSFTLADTPNAQRWLQLYIGVDAKTLSGLRVTVGERGVELEKVDGDKSQVLATGTLEIQGREQTLGVLWRRGELSVWLGAKEALTTKLSEADAVALKLPSGGTSLVEGVRLGPRRAVALSEIDFSDTFMRATAGDIWKPVGGKWELTALAFPERSANPFALRTFFGNDKLSDDKLYQGRLRGTHFGLGVEISPFEGTLHIVRITGGSPAARAGLAEDDIFLEIDGARVEDMQPWQAHALLTQGGFRNEVHLKMLRPGEKQPREFRITKDQFRWGTPAEGIAIEPQGKPLTAGDDRLAMIVGGEQGWSDYVAQAAVKPLGSGGAGIAVGVLSEKDYLVFRWRGPAPRPPKKRPADDDEQFAEIEEPLPPRPTDCIELVRVKDGVEKILASKEAAYRPYEFYRMAVDWDGAQIRCLIDGNEMLRANVPDLKRGAVALYSMRGDPVFFDDVRVVSKRETIAGLRSERAINQIFAHEGDMEIWANPALEWERSVESGWALHRGRFPGDQSVVIHKPRFDKLELAAFTNASTDQHYSVRAAIADGKATVGGGAWSEHSIALDAGPIQRIALRAGSHGGELEIDGKRAPFTRGPGFGSKPAADAFGENTRVAIRGLKNLGDPAAVRVSSSNTLEYTFDNAPSDWKVESGRWGLLNKWICDPRWSWFGGRTTTIAALWNKNVFRGDITVEAHVALMMQKDDPPFERPGDYNIALCGDGVNLDSGYTLIFGGDNNTWTRLYRKGVLVAESNKEEHRIFSDRIRHPDKPQLHQRWFHLKLEKLGDTVSFYRDGNLAFTFKDPEPIEKGRVGFWTLDNGFILSRVRIAHGGAETAPFESRRTLLYEDARVVNAYDGETYGRVEPQKLPQAVALSLDAAPATFKPVEASGLPDKDAAFQGAGPPAYRVVNGIGGGPCVLQWKNLTIDPENRGVVRFAYRIEPGAKVDLYLIDTSGREGSRAFNPRNSGAYRWRLTGPETSDEFAPLVGSIPNVKADGKWRTVQFDLQPSWRAFWNSRGFNRGGNVNYRVMIGNLSNQGYLLAGMNGNHVGSAYSISDIQVMTPRDIDAIPAKVSRVIWPYDADGDGRSIVLQFDDADGCGVASESLDLHLNDAAIPKELLKFDAQKQTLSVDLNALNLPGLKEGSAFNLKLLGFQDRATNASPSFSAEWKYAAEKVFAAKKRPAPPVLTLRSDNTEQLMGSLPLQMSDAVTYGGRSFSRLQDSSDAPPWAPSNERTSLQVVCPHDGRHFGFTLNRAQFDLRRWQYIQIDYKVPFETPFNMHMMDGWGATHALILTDLEDGRDHESGNIHSRFGPPADFVADGTWRSMTVPLGALYKAFNPHGTTEMVGLDFHDNGWRGTRRDMTFWIHRVLPVPAVRPGDISFSWRAYDLTGVPDYATVIDQKPDTEPVPGTVDIKPTETLAESLRRRNVSLKDGWTWIHLRVRNGAGQWSETVHRKFYLDNSGPKIVRVEPSKGATTAGQTLRLYVDDPSGVNWRSLQMSVNDRIIAGTTQGVSYDAEKRCIIYNAAAANAPFQSGAEIRVEVRALNDDIGNGLDEPFVFSFIADRTADKEGPVITRMRWAAATEQSGQPRQQEMETSFGLNFEEHFGHVHVMRDCKFEWVNDPAQAAFGKRAAKFTALQDDADAQIMLHKNPWYLDRFPLLHFDYKVDPGFKTDLLVNVMGEWLCIKFTGDGVAPPDGRKIGAIDGVVADGTWRHASVDLRALIDSVKKDLPVRIVNKIIFSTQGRDGCKRGATLSIDNLDLSHEGGHGGRVEWEASDPSGIAGYSFVADQSPATVPEQRVNAEATAAYVGGVEGVWYVHVRAVDYAGNWGPTRHLKLDFGK
ncbi:MAG TPA: DUF6250 domain-containing protein [Planctomycetota bacterium]|nr:DUF6250 domain-containing protein [Planctomycetota bacterium]